LNRLSRLSRAYLMLQEAVINFSLHGCSRMAAALAYYTLFSIFPLLLILVSLLGLALQYYPNSSLDARTYVFELVAFYTSNDLARWLDERLLEIQNLRTTGGLIGAVVLFFGASGVFAQLDEAFNEIWGLPVPDYGFVRAAVELVRKRFFSFLMVLGLGFLTIAALLLSSTLRALEGLTVSLPYSATFWYVVGLGVLPLLNWIILMVVYKIMPDTYVAWGDVWLAAGVTTLLLEGAKRIFTWYISAFGVANTYGAIGNVVVFMLLIYFGAQIVFLGGELSASYARHYGSRVALHPARQHQPPVPAVRLGRHRLRLQSRRKPATRTGRQLTRRQ
jgi:membrane protein